ncbi:MAG: hypothetical protein JWO29_1402 [Arthrobacter sp.]|nr:hypothetical protein [Arthrobacter sp.]
MVTPALALNFRHFDLTDGGPASAIFVDKKKTSLCGIYILEFEDEKRYVGKTVNIVGRLTAHRRHHGDVVAFKFAECLAADLDHYERQMIRATQVHYELRNLKLTDWPAGRGDIEYTTEAGVQVLLPWERRNRETVLQEPANSKSHRYWDLSSVLDYPEILAHLARYVHETIPDPVDTQRTLWSLSALPSTSRRRGFRRLFTLNCGSVEALFVTETIEDDGSRSVEWNINLSPVEGVLHALDVLGGDEPLSAFSYSEVSYGNTGRLLQLHCNNPDALVRVLQNELILDAMYGLNVRLMRSGSSVFGKHHNPQLASDVLRTASFLSAD